MLVDGGLRVGALGTEIGDGERRLQRQAGRHDLSPNGGDVLVFERTRVGLFDFFNHLGHPVGAEEGRTFAAFDFAHLLGHTGALVDQAQQLLVEGINLHPQFSQRRQVGGRWMGQFRRSAHKPVFSNAWR